MKIILLLILSAFEISLQEEDKISGMMTRFIENCTRQSSLNRIISCVTERSLEMVLKASAQRTLQVFPGLEIVSNISETEEALNIHDLPTDPKKKQEELMQLLVNATSRFISNSVLKVKLPKNSAERISRALEEGRGKKKKLDLIKFGLGAFSFTVLSVILSGVGLISAKALVIGKIALVLSIVLFAQGFFLGGRNMLPITYGAKPNYAYNGHNNPSLTYGYGTNSLGGWTGQQDGYPYARSIDGSSSV